MLERIKDIAERIKQFFLHIGGHEVEAHHMASMGGPAAAFGSYPAALLTLGATAAISSGLMQLEYNHERGAIRRLYEDELAAKLGTRKIKYKDLHSLAAGDIAKNLEGNTTISDALKSARKKRNFGVGIAVIASLGALTLLGFAFGSAGLAAHGIAHASHLLSWAGAAQAAVGFLTYQAIKTPLYWASCKLFGLDKETAHDHIVAMHRDRAKGRFITREQVFSVFAAANKELGAMIKAQYGKEYDKLPLAQKQFVAISVGRMISLDKITDAINHGRMRPTELAFTVQGEVSGFDPVVVPQHKGLLGKLKDKVLHHAPDNGAGIEPPVMPTYSREPEPEKSEKSFVSRLGLGKASTSVGHVERLEQARAAEASLLQQR